MKNKITIEVHPNVVRVLKDGEEKPLFVVPINRDTLTADALAEILARGYRAGKSAPGRARVTVIVFDAAGNPTS